MSQAKERSGDRTRNWDGDEDRDSDRGRWIWEQRNALWPLCDDALCSQSGWPCCSVADADVAVAGSVGVLAKRRQGV